jgi:HSP20 family molecular chaperone IbpA
VARREKLKMITRFKDLITSVDVLNTLHGGVSEAHVSFREQPDQHEIHVRVPGVRREAMQVEINNNEISVFYLIPIESNSKMIYMPQVVHSQKIPTFVEANGIKAVFDENELIVQLPFNKLSNGQNRKIQIEE